MTPPFRDTRGATSRRTQSCTTPSPASYRRRGCQSISCCAARSLPHRLLHGADQLLQGERLGQEIVLARIRQALLEGVLGVAGHEDDLEVGIVLAQLLEQRR